MRKTTRLSRLQSDLIWNYISLAVTAACGILINFLIGFFYDNSAALGVFNQVFAAYVIFSQFGVLGIHYSVLKHIADRADRRSAVISTFLAAMIPASLLALIVAVVFWFSRHLIGEVLSSPQVAQGMRWATAGLFFFSLNKVMLGAINGLRWMKSFAFLQAMRPVGMIGCFFILSIYNAPYTMLPMILTVAEVLLFTCALGVIGSRGYLLCRPRRLLLRVRKHTSFGVRSIGAGLLIELHTRIDILMLGYFLDDTQVGIYSFAAIMAEGAYQLLIVVRNNYNPILVQMLRPGQQQSLRQLIRKCKWTTYLLFSVVMLIGVLLYPRVIDLSLGSDSPYHQSWPMFIILICGITLSSGYMPFSGILLQGGRPGLQTLLMSGVVLFGIITNVSLIPFYGAIGAAVATGMTFVFYAWLLHILTLKALNVRL